MIQVFFASMLTVMQRPRYSPRPERKSKTPVPEPTKEEDRALRSGSEEGEIEED
jgi:pre-mRNA-processing factor 40